jgi:fructose-bisphosphate aldolase class II
MRSLFKTLKVFDLKRKALPHFNISGFEQFIAISNIARKLNLPVLIGVSKKEGEYLGFDFVKSWVDFMNKKYGDKEDPASFWIFLNADHISDLELAKNAANLFFDEIVFDQSKKSLEENIELTKKAVKVLKKENPKILIEGELGYIGESSKVWEKIPSGVLNKLPTPSEAKKFVLETKVDLLSPACGNIHGLSKKGKNPHLDIDLISKIKKATNTFLVLHGASGVSEKDLVLAINAGINIIHISTEIRLILRKEIEKAFKLNPEEIAPYNIMQNAILEIEKFVENKMKLFYKLD